MRFPQVNVGQRFTYQGKPYTKTGPLTASEEGSGKQRMIPRAAEVTLLDTQGKPVKEIKQRYSRAEVRSLVQHFKTDLVGRLEQIADDEGGLKLDQVIELIQAQEAGD
ncbi:MAG: hypothetical protein P8103_13860 [Candidatus Thiodiazotropha sp.]